MRTTPRYPVDRYLVESNNKIEMVNLIDDELWAPEPAMRPEDEAALRRLHEVLQATADDLKQLSSQLTHHRPTSSHPYLHKTQSVPLDEEFNEKIHIEELVNAKFHGYNVIDKPLSKTSHSESSQFAPKPNINTGVQVNTLPILKKSAVNKNLGITRTRIIEIEENKSTKPKVNNTKTAKSTPSVAYNEFIYENVKPTIVDNTQQNLKKQDMPKINIRSELKEQKVLQLDIFPDSKAELENTTKKNNVAVIAVEHEKKSYKEDPKIVISSKIDAHQSDYAIKRVPIRRVSKLSTYESSGSTNNISSDTQLNMKTQMQIKSIIRSSPKPQTRDRSKSKKNNFYKKELEKRVSSNLEEWKRKLNIVYGQPSTSKNAKSVPKVTNKTSLKKSNLSLSVKKPQSSLNNAEYIPYSQLTLGGVNVSDIEREISGIPNKNDMPLSPVLDKILSSRENSFHGKSPKKHNSKESPRIFTTSDENLLQEVIDIERTVSQTIEKNVEQKSKRIEDNLSVSNNSKENESKDSYADDFEEDKSDISHNTETNNALNESEHEAAIENDNEDNIKDNTVKRNINENDEHTYNKTFTKASGLAIKESVDVFEFVHFVDTQDTATQSHTTHKMSLKETQTSPRNEKPNIQPIHNDLWTLDPQGEMEKMFKLEKDFIKNLIVEEYGDLIQKNVAKPSTSTDSTEIKQRNIAAIQKNTQTSPARVKSVTTSPAKIMTNSQFFSVTMDRQTSPIVVVTNEEQVTVQVEDNEEAISINLSSPRFSLRLPQSSREVLSKLEGASLTPSEIRVDKKSNRTVNVVKSRTHRKNIISSSSSEVENSSEMSSLGEIRLKLKRRLKKRVSSISESSETSSVSKYSYDLPSGGIIPLRSEGEISFGQTIRKESNKTSKSEGETSFIKVSK